jgi:hypothetical protein
VAAASAFHFVGEVFDGVEVVVGEGGAIDLDAGGALSELATTMSSMRVRTKTGAKPVNRAASDPDATRGSCISSNFYMTHEGARIAN